MLDVLSGGVLGSIFGGLFRLAPEVIKFVDRKDERKHELAMFELQTNLEVVKGKARIEEQYTDYSIEQLKAIQEAFKEQSNTSKEAGKFVSAVSALVRPGITWSLFFLYAIVKIVAVAIAIDTSAQWTEVVIKAWTVEDFAMLNMCLTFWFVGRAIEKYQK